MKTSGPVRSAMPPHSRHANTTGTDAPEAEGAACPCRAPREAGIRARRSPL